MLQIINDLLNNIPDYKEFLTVDEMDENSKRLAANYPETTEIFEIGKTRGGCPLYCLKIGDGPKNALAFGLPHPNEPIGAMMLEYLSAELAKSKALIDAIGYTWYIVKAWDVDGAKLNEDWFKGPYNIYNYASNFFRPAGHQQVDWTFPIDYKELHFHDTLPETVAMMNLIDQVKPSFIYSLHNAGFGGAYWYITKECPEVYEDMHKAATKNGIPLSLGEPEMPSCVTLAPAIYQAMGITTEYDYMEKYSGMDMKEVVEIMRVGTCSAQYASERFDSFTLITELPYFYDKRIDSQQETDMIRRDAVLKKLDLNKQSKQEVLDILSISKEYIAPENPFWLAIESFTDFDSALEPTTRSMVEQSPEYQRNATEAEVFDNLYMSRFYDSLMYGLLLRANITELEKMDSSGESNEAKRATLGKAGDEAKKALKTLADYLEEQLDYAVIPIKKLVALQLECGLLLAEHLK